LLFAAHLQKLPLSSHSSASIPQSPTGSQDDRELRATNSRFIFATTDQTKPMNKLNNPETVWHSLESGQLFEQTGSSEDGLDHNEIELRQSKFGPNRLPPPPGRSLWQRMAAQFQNLLILVLLVAAAGTLLLGHTIDAAVIIGVVVINALIGFIQEGKAERALDAVRKMLSPQATVIRAGERMTIAAEQLVPGDIAFIQSGDRVPADLRLWRVRELRIDEAMLTGESVPIEKSTRAVAEDAPLGDRRGMAYSGTLVTSGQGYGVVVGTGANSEIGRICALLARVETLTTPLTRQMDRFARWLTGAILVIASLTALFGVAMRDYSVGEMFLAAVGLAVAAIPEGLPAIITITLAIGVQRMARRNAIIRRLPAVETLGSVTTICSDKTGTLTHNEMMVSEIITADGRFSVTGSGYNPHGGFALAGSDILPEQQPALNQLCRAGLLCNDATLHPPGEGEQEWRISGDPTEGALLVAAIKAGFDPQLLAEQLPRNDVIPFESQHRFMATLHHDHLGASFVVLKGAVESVVPRCSGQLAGGEIVPIDQALWEEAVEQLAAAGQRTLAIATSARPEHLHELHFTDVDSGLTLLGVVGIIDPPRQEAIEAISHCRSAGIRVKMITGDHIITARAIASQMGIGDSGGCATAGPELEHLDRESLIERVAECDIFARASPEHKLRLVEALQARNEVVAMTGDGVNDAPALKRADVGVAMGIKGTEAAKEAAEMVLADDHFASISSAVEEGRNVYDNIRKSILFILPTNGGEALILIAAIALGRMLPVTAVQILWVNMITAVTLALSLAFEPGERNLMQRPPRDPAEPLLNRFMVWRVTFVSLLMVAGAFGLFILARESGRSIEEARTLAVNTLVIIEAFYLLNTRFLLAPAISKEGISGNRWVAIAIAIVVFFQLLFTYLPPMRTLFGTAPLTIADWGAVVAVGAAVFLLVETEKWFFRMRRRSGGNR
jgi:magnesium-transporting ATPase (P-type)